MRLMARIVVTGGTGYIGGALVERLVSRGDDVTIFTRGPSQPGRPAKVQWDPYALGSWVDAVDGADAVVHLIGERAVGARYTEAVKRRIYDSRVVSTRNLVSAIERAKQRPRVLVSASAVGYYGDRPASEPADETAPAGHDFLARLCVDWESAAERARDFGVRVVSPRIGVVFGPGDGPLRVMALPFKLFVGGKLGSGEQGISWIHLNDAVSGLLRFIDDEELAGKVNLCAPSPASNAEISAAIAKVLGRPNLFTVPKFALSALFGEGAETIVTGQYALPRALQARGFEFQFPDLIAAVKDGLGAH